MANFDAFPRQLSKAEMKFKAKLSNSVGEPYIVYKNDVIVKDGINHIPFYITMFL